MTKNEVWRWVLDLGEVVDGGGDGGSCDFFLSLPMLRFAKLIGL